MTSLTTRVVEGAKHHIDVKTHEISTDLNPKPNQRLTITTVWPQLAAGIFFIASCIYAFMERSAVALAYCVGLGSLFLVTILYLVSLQLGWRRLTVVLTWVGGMGLALVFTLMLPTFQALFVVCVFAMVSYGLGASQRQIMYLGTLLAWGTLGLTLVVSMLARSGVISLGSQSFSPWLEGAFTVLALALTGDIFQRLWRHYIRTETAFNSLQTANVELDHVRERLEKHVRAQSELLDVSRVISSTLELDPLLDEILVQLKRVVNYESAALLVAHDDGLRLLRHIGSHAEHMRELANVISETDEWSHARDAGHPIHLRNKSAANILPQIAEHLPPNTHSIVCAPLIVRGREIGMLLLTQTEPAQFAAEDAELAMAFANQAAVAVEAARAKVEAVSNATMAERNRLARELHDSVSQALFGMVLTTHTSLELMETDTDRARTSMRYLLGLASTALSDMRALIFELRPEFLKEEGLLAALNKQLSTMIADHAIDLNLELNGEEPNVPLDVKEALYRVALEAFQNAVRHANAQSITVSLKADENEMTLRVVDDGCGFDPQAPHPGHLGLTTMCERIEGLGGSVAVNSAVGQGTAVCITIPFDRTRQPAVVVMPAPMPPSNVATHALQ